MSDETTGHVRRCAHCENDEAVKAAAVLPEPEPADNCEGQEAAYDESTEPGAFPVMGDPWARGHGTDESEA